MHNNWIRREYKIKIKEKSFVFNPPTNPSGFAHPIQFICMRNFNSTAVYEVRFSYDMNTKILILLDDVLGKEVIISYFVNLQEERKLKLQKLNESR